MGRYRWGIIATGYIAASLAEAINHVEDAELLAVASRSQASADQFGDHWNVPRRYSSYQQLVEDPDVEVVYIATPHNLHADNMKRCLEAGKHVLCEKPLTINADQARECIQLARDKNLFLMEAVWMRFFPAIQKLKSLVQAGVVGKPRLIEADFCFQLPYDPKHRLYDLSLGGGALLDIGIYPLSFTTNLIGFPTDAQAVSQLAPTGADQITTINLKYADDCAALLAGSMHIYKPQDAIIAGENGYIKVHESFYHPDRFTVHVAGKEPEEHHLPYELNGYPHEVREVHRCLDEGLTESPLMSLDESLQMMELMDQLRTQIGVKYPADVNSTD